MEDNLGYLRLEHSKLREEVAAPLKRLLTATAEENKVKTKNEYNKFVTDGKDLQIILAKKERRGDKNKNKELAEPRR